MAWRPLLLLLVVPVVATGCGTIERGKQRLAEAMNPNGSSVWIARANRICADRATAVRRLPTPRTQTELIDAGARIVSIEELERSRLARSVPPVNDRDELSDFLDAIRLVQGGIGRVSSALQRRDTADLADARAALAAARQQANAKARGLGLTCLH